MLGSRAPPARGQVLVLFFPWSLSLDSGLRFSIDSIEMMAPALLSYAAHSKKSETQSRTPDGCSSAITSPSAVLLSFPTRLRQHSTKAAADGRSVDKQGCAPGRETLLPKAGCACGSRGLQAPDGSAGPRAGPWFKSRPWRSPAAGSFLVFWPL